MRGDQHPVVEFIASPTRLLRNTVVKNKAESFGFEVGRVSLACEIVSMIRTLEDQTMYATVEVQPIIAALHTLLRDQGFSDELWEFYDRMSSLRRASRRRALSLRDKPDAS